MAKYQGKTWDELLKQPPLSKDLQKFVDGQKENFLEVSTTRRQSNG